MEWVETTGRSVADALDDALDKLGVPEDEVEFEVVSEPRAGLLGIGARDARIRARVKPKSREKPGDRSRRRRPRKGSGGGGRGGSRERSPASGGSRPKRSRGSSRDDKPRGGDRDGEASGSGETRRPASAPRNEAPATASKKGAAVNQVRDEPEVSVQEQADEAEHFVAGVVDAFGVDADVVQQIDDDAISIDVTGEDLGLLVGPRGATLTAIEELARTVLQRQAGGYGARLRVDVGGYRAKRRAALAEFATDLAQRVLDGSTEQALEPMGAADRKVVHDTVAEIDGVTTASEGDEPRRRVVIRPD